jgi:putative CocE/NonD family hydrolase
VFNPLSKEEARDGAAAVEWLAAQPWSNGRVGMFGLSFPAMVQFGVAAEHPPHLRAIAPAQFSGDLYREIGFPGGILNAGFAALWTAGLQPVFTGSARRATPRTATSVALCGWRHASPATC